MKYFDYAASCPLDKEAAQVYVQAATDYYGNSSSLHDIGSQALDLLENSRYEIANLLGVDKAGIYFTSGGTEGNFFAIHALLSSIKNKGKHIVTGMAEHSSIHSTLEKLRQEDYEVTPLPFDASGHISINQLIGAIREDTVLITLQHGNSEIGTIQPLEEVSAICKEKGILLHSDCVQTFGKTNLKPIARIVDSLTISGHKFYGPKGIGAVYIQPHLQWMPYHPSATHEKGFRPGTVNVPAIVAMTIAAKKAYENLDNYHKHYEILRNAFINTLEPHLLNFVMYHSDIPSTIGMRIKGVEGQMVMLECNRFGFSISTGSACQVGQQTPSKTMLALGVEDKSAKEFIRISFGRETNVEDVRELALTIGRIIQEQT